MQEHFHTPTTNVLVRPDQFHVGPDVSRQLRCEGSFFCLRLSTLFTLLLTATAMDVLLIDGVGHTYDAGVVERDGERQTC